MKQMHKHLLAILALSLMLGYGKQVLANAHNGGQSGAAFHLALAAFDYIPVNTRTACFTWTTSQEFNVQQIELQASTDSNNFVTLDIQSAFNYKFGHTYYSGVINVDQYKYYRLAILNENGDYDYSKIIRVATGSLTKQDISLFPNPVTGLAFNIKVPSLNPIAVNVFTKEGVLLYTTNLQGQFQYRIKLPSSASASMNLVVQVTNNSQTQSFNVLNK
ncbi:MAG TPA: hypothetical protein VK543_01235 [Puia sp.]|nr:hypothetical protein [Puia sp.]